jgi:hypothetical protein
MESSILLATSIAPGGRLELQRAAVGSWLTLGFEVVSLNSPAEIGVLAAEFGDIEFVPQVRTAQSILGTPLIFISDILAYLKQSERPICGIVNSDIFAAADKNFSAYLTKQAKDALVFSPRYQIDSLDDANLTADALGFDFFVFDRNLIGEWNESHFCLGMASWDHWFPLMPLLAGRKVRKLYSPIAKHVRHATPPDRHTMAYNNEFIGTVIDRIKNAPGKPQSAQSQSAIDDFGGFDLTQPYMRLIDDLKRVEGEGANDAAINDCYENLARFFDEFTRHVIRFLGRNAEKITYEF